MTLEDTYATLRQDARDPDAWARVVHDVEIRCEQTASQYRAVIDEQGRAVVDEVKTEAVVRVVRRVLDLSQPEILKPRAYVATVVRNVWVDAYRRLHPSSPAPVREHAQPDPADLVRADPASRHLFVALADAALADLAPRYRAEQSATFDELSAMFFDGLDYATVVREKHRIDPGSAAWDTVCGRLYTRHRRARQRLRAAASRLPTAARRAEAAALLDCLAWCRKSPARTCAPAGTDP